jgi:hypothetical protein
MVKTTVIPHNDFPSNNLSNKFNCGVTIRTHPNILYYSDGCTSSSANDAKCYGKSLTVIV